MPRTSSNNAAISACEKDGASTMPCSKIMPSTSSHNAVISACEKDGVSKMHCGKIMPNTSSFNAAISACGKRGVSEMPSSTIMPPLSSLCRAWFDLGSDDTSTDRGSYGNTCKTVRCKHAATFRGDINGSSPKASKCCASPFEKFYAHRTPRSWFKHPYFKEELPGLVDVAQEDRVHYWAWAYCHDEAMTFYSNHDLPQCEPYDEPAPQTIAVPNIAVSYDVQPSTRGKTKNRNEEKTPERAPVIELSHASLCALALYCCFRGMPTPHRFPTCSSGSVFQALRGAWRCQSQPTAMSKRVKVRDVCVYSLAEWAHESTLQPKLEPGMTPPDSVSPYKL